MEIYLISLPGLSLQLFSCFLSNSSCSNPRFISPYSSSLARNGSLPILILGCRVGEARKDKERVREDGEKLYSGELIQFRP